MRVLCTFLAVFVIVGGTVVSAQTPNTPIQHVIIVIQENRTPDNLFHEDKPLIKNGAHVMPPNDVGSCLGKNVPMRPTVLNVCFDLGHYHDPSWLDQYDNGLMDGACRVMIYPGKCIKLPSTVPALAQYTYVTDGDHLVDPYFQIAEQYGFANWMFGTNQGPSFNAHLFLFAGTSAPEAYDPNDLNKYYQWFSAENTVISKTTGCTAADTAIALEVNPSGVELPGFDRGYPCYDIPTLASVLDKAQISWKYYAENPYQIWTSPNTIASICGPAHSTVCSGDEWDNNVVSGPNGPGQVITDINSCNLAGVSWVTPDGVWSDHPGSYFGTNDGGPSWVASIVNAVGGSPCNYWSNTAVFVLWDDWGGFYDDVVPYGCGPGLPCGYSNGTGKAYVYGFRVPFLVVSAYTKYTSHPKGQPYVGYVSGASGEVAPYIHDFGSMLNFIEYAFGTDGHPLGWPNPGISPDYPYADQLAPDVYPTCSSQQLCPYGLADFFDFTQQPRTFYKITGAKYPTKCFVNPKDCFRRFFPQEPDNELEEDPLSDKYLDD